MATRRSRHERSEKLMHEYEKLTGIKPGYPKTNIALYELQKNIIDIYKSRSKIASNSEAKPLKKTLNKYQQSVLETPIIIKETESSFAGFSKSYKISVDRPLEILLEKAILHILKNFPEPSKILVSMLVRFQHAVYPENKYARPYIKTKPFIILADTVISDTVAAIAQELENGVDTYTRSGSGWIFNLKRIFINPQA